VAPADEVVGEQDAHLVAAQQKVTDRLKQLCGINELVLDNVSRLR
jgi:hypothetical protein